MSWFLADTKKEIFFTELLAQYKPNGKIAGELWERLQPFNSEEEWQFEIEQLSVFVEVLKNNPYLLTNWQNYLNQFNDIRSLLDKIYVKDWERIDPLTDGYNVKQFLWFSYTLSKQIREFFLAQHYNNFKQADWLVISMQPWEFWLKKIDLKANDNVYYPHFALQDIDNERLIDLRKEKRTLINQQRSYAKNNREQIEEKYGKRINYDGYLLVSLKDEKLSEIKEDKRLRFVRQQGEELVYFMPPASEEEQVQREIEKIEEIIKKEEKYRLVEIFEGFIENIPLWNQAHLIWSKFEILFKKAQMAIELDFSKPLLTKNNEEFFILKNGFHPFINSLWSKRSYQMKPISIQIRDGANVLYGANMNGKTVVLRTVGLLVALAQYGFYVPAEHLSFSLVSHLFLLTGDYQDLENGLSSFGGEIKQLREALNLKGKILYLIDEVGRGTNPIEGEAIAIGVLRFLKQRSTVYSVLVTHFPEVIQEQGIKLFEVKDYQVKEITKGEMAFEAITIAERLGLQPSVIKNAKEFLKHESNKEK